MKSKVVFIADFFKKDLLGGAESNDSVLIEHLEQSGYEVEKKNSREVRVSDFVSNDSTFIVGNFVALSEEVKSAMANGRAKYIIYEHDHKYVSNRNPAEFPDFVAPPKYLVNKKFYQSAHKVFVLSSVCAQVIKKNLGIDNVVNIGTSLWSKEKFELIRRLQQEPNDKTIEYAVMESGNPTKGMQAALNYCNSKQLNYSLIGSKEEEVFLKQLKKTDKLVFIPQVLETFNRLSVEAKMLECKLITKPKLLGFASESCFELSGAELIDEMESRVNAALKSFESAIDSQGSPQSKPVVPTGDITAILTCYKRPQLLEEQILALKNQTVPPKDIWVWINEPDEHDFDYSEIKRKIDIHGVKIFDSNHNWKFFGRFAAALLADTEYIAVYDDDTIPAKKWHQNCLQTMRENEGIMGGVGVILPPDGYRGHSRVGWSNPNEELCEVDLVGHAWFFKRDWAQYFWVEKPYTWDNGEDIHFSYMCQKYGQVKTYVPPHPRNQPDMFSSTKGMQYGVDDVATSATRNHQVFYKQRDSCVRHAVANGWKLVKWC